MNWRHISKSLDGFLRLQATCVGIVAASWAVFWAVNQPVTSVRDLFIYVLTQVNLTVLLLKPLKLSCESGKFRHSWPLYVAAAPVAATAVVVVASTGAVYLVNGWHFGYADFLHRSWRFPTVANLVYSFAFEVYQIAAFKLRARNQQLQQVIDIESAARELDASELQQARDIQRGLLPKQIPQLAEFAITGAWEPARVVGGDYYDVIRLSKDKLGICIADVAGKGVSAALLMANVQAAVRAFASEEVPPSRLCSQINSVLHTNTAPDKFATLFYGVLDARTRTLQYTNAGHPRPLIIHSNGEIQQLENGDALLGVFPDSKYEDASIELKPGDLLLLFTDGITEATAMDGEEFGEERLVAVAKSAAGSSLEDVQSTILERVKDFCDSQLSDDATLLMLAASPAAPEERKPALIRDREGIIQYAGALS